MDGGWDDGWGIKEDLGRAKVEAAVQLQLHLLHQAQHLSLLLLSDQPDQQGKILCDDQSDDH